MSRPEPMERCYVCGGFVGTSGQRDHFPTPARSGGVDTIPICLPCHDIKDRITVGSWNPSDAFIALAGLWGKASRDERLMLVKLFHVATNPARSKRRNAK